MKFLLNSWNVLAHLLWQFYYLSVLGKKKHIFLQSSLGIQWVSMGMMLSLEPSWHYLEVVGADNQEGWAPADRGQRSCSTPNSVQVGPTTKDYPAQTYNQGFLSQVPNEHLLKAAPWSWQVGEGRGLSIFGLIFAIKWRETVCVSGIFGNLAVNTSVIYV